MKDNISSVSIAHQIFEAVDILIGKGNEGKERHQRSTYLDLSCRLWSVCRSDLLDNAAVVAEIADILGGEAEKKIHDRKFLVHMAFELWMKINNLKEEREMSIEDRIDDLESSVNEALSYLN